MATLSHVTVTKQSQFARQVYQWPQPWLNGDDIPDWYATDQFGVQHKVQRDRLTDDVYWCSAYIDIGPNTGFNVDTGAVSSPSVLWSAPTLTGLGLQWTGHDGSVHKADFTDITKRDILRDGHVLRVERRYMLSKVTATVGSGNMVQGDGILCHHVYLTFRADLPDHVEVAVLMSNAAAEVETDAASLAVRGGGIKSAGPTQLATIGFTDVALTLPVGWIVGAVDRPMASSSTLPPTNLGYVSEAHAFPRKAATVRRWVIYRSAASGLPAQTAVEVDALKGLSRAEFNAQNPNWRSYHTVRAYGPTKTLLPDITSATFRRADGVTVSGYAGAASQASSFYQALFAISNNSAHNFPGTGQNAGSGSADPTGEYGGTWFLKYCSRMGMFHASGPLDTEAPGGDDISPYCARAHVPEFVLFSRQKAGHMIDGDAVYLFERTSGRPLRTSDFADAYAGGAVFQFTGSLANAGIKQPFNFYTQHISTYEYTGTDTQRMAGWTPRDTSWPPHFLANDGTGQWPNSSMAEKWWPKRTSLWGTAPRSIMDFDCDYRPLLEIVPYSASPDAQTFGGQPSFLPAHAFRASTPYVQQFPADDGQQWGVKDPYNGQHAIKMFRHLIPLAWLGGDVLAIDVMDMQAEWLGLEYSEVGYLPSGSGGPSANLNGRSLFARLASNTNTPHVANYGTGRQDAWTAYLFATQYALAEVSRREFGYASGKGIKKRCEMMFDFIRLGIITVNGMHARIPFGGNTSGTSQSSIWGPGLIPQNYSVQQAGLEHPKVNLGLFALLKQCEGFLSLTSVPPNPTGQLKLDNAAALLLTGFREFVARTDLYVTSGTLRTPHNFWGVWDNTLGVPVDHAHAVGATGTFQPHFDDVSCEIEIAYRLSGDASVFTVANYLGFPASPLTMSPAERSLYWLNSTGTGYSLGFIQLMRTLGGADVGFTPPSVNPRIVGRLSPSPVVQGQTTKISGLVTPGMNPTSVSYQCFANLASVGGDPSTEIFDDGVAPDTVADDLRFTGEIDTATLSPGSYALSVSVTDDQGRPDLDPLTLVVVGAATAPTVTVSTAPFPVVEGQALTLYATVVLGTAPASTGVTVTADLSAIGGSASQAFLDDGVSPDVTGSDLIYTTRIASVSGVGDHTLKVVVTDAQDRYGSGPVNVTVSEAPVADVFSVTVSLTPNPATAGDTVLVEAKVTPDPLGGEVVVEANLDAVGGAASVPMLDDGVAPDLVADDSVYSTSFVASVSGKVRVVASNKIGNSVVDSIAFTALDVVDPTDPLLVEFTADPNPITQGETTALSVTVIPGTSPDSTGIAVLLDLTAFGLSNKEPMVDQGGDLWTFDLDVPLDTLPGAYTITASLTDDQTREASATLPLVVNAFVPVPTSNVGLLVKAQSGVRYLVALNASERLTVRDQDGARYEIQNSPDVAASVGGQLPVTSAAADGAVFLVPFRVPTVTPPTDPPVIVTPGESTGGERQTRGGARQEKRRGG